MKNLIPRSLIERTSQDLLSKPVAEAPVFHRETSFFVGSPADTNVSPGSADVNLFEGDCLQLLSSLPSSWVSVIITSPPYNIGKPYEKRTPLEEYLSWQREVIKECVRVLRPEGSIFWEVGNHVFQGEVFPLDVLFYPIFKDLGLKLRNRIIWHFGHGLHCTKRLSGRYEVILWVTKSDQYYFDLDAIRVPQEWPNKKAYKGPNKGKLTCNPLGKNPTDVWEITNVKNNHPEKTAHPCQFPEALVERLIRATSRVGDITLDPFAGSGTTLVVAKRLRRKAIGAEINPEYIAIAKKRLDAVPLPLL